MPIDIDIDEESALTLKPIITLSQMVPEVLVSEGTPSPEYINIDEPRYDQGTYLGRLKHFFVLTNPLNNIASDKQLDEAKAVIDNYRKTKTLPPNMTEDELWKAKYLMDSAFHPDTKEKMPIIGRLSSQVPGHFIITAGMLTWYKTRRGIVTWQVLNQSFNAFVNYTNRSGDHPISDVRLAASFGVATTSATATALFLSSLASKMNPLAARFVPFFAVATANCINIPFMRSIEIEKGIHVKNKEGKEIAQSPTAAKQAIIQVVISRIFLATRFIFCPIAMNFIEKKYPKLRTRSFPAIGLNLVLIGSCLVFATPMCCAIFPQKSAMKIEKLEEPIRNKLIEEGYNETDLVYFNKGL